MSMMDRRARAVKPPPLSHRWRLLREALGLRWGDVAAIKAAGQRAHGRQLRFLARSRGFETVPVAPP
jgi:hypothetical protein